MASTTYHIHIPIDTLLAMPDEELAGTLSPGTGVELRTKLVCMKASGKVVFTGDNCDRQDAEGKCLGHRRDGLETHRPTQRTVVTLSATMPAEVAARLAEFCAGLTFESALNLTDKTQPLDERERRAHLVIAGIEGVRHGLWAVGFHSG